VFHIVVDLLPGKIDERQQELLRSLIKLNACDRLPTCDIRPYEPYDFQVDLIVDTPGLLFLPFDLNFWVSSDSVLSLDFIPGFFPSLEQIIKSTLRELGLGPLSFTICSHRRPTTSGVLV
jgi:hypothetical protein